MEELMGLYIIMKTIMHNNSLLYDKNIHVSFPKDRI